MVEEFHPPYAARGAPSDPARRLETDGAGTT
jgi:hypothetical protein